MKKILSLLTVLALLLALLTGCGAAKTPATSGDDEAVELIVFAAASLTEALTELGEAYSTVAPDVALTFNFESSGTLKTQIEEGADCDVFISAGQPQMDGLDIVLEGSRFDILENKVALIVPDGNPAGIHGFADLRAALTDGGCILAMGNADVPAGQYTQKILKYFELSEDALAADGAITYATNVKEICTQVREGAVDCGIVYQTDAISAGLTVADTATGVMCGQVIYPAAVLNTSPHAEAAAAFLDYLTGDGADAVFEAIGFTPVA